MTLHLAWWGWVLFVLCILKGIARGIGDGDGGSFFGLLVWFVSAGWVWWAIHHA